MLTKSFILLLAVLADKVLGEPARYHPLIGFGRLANRVERSLNKPTTRTSARLSGILAVGIVVLPVVLLTAELTQTPLLVVNMVVTIIVLFFCVGGHSLQAHTNAILAALRNEDLPGARVQLSKIVSRDTQHLNQEEIAQATLESTLENGNDAVFGALFWFLVAGAPGAIAYRLINTLDAMWGYRTARFIYFGWFAARCDDALNWVPARLTALSYAFLGNFKQALRCWRKQGRRHASFNAGVVMAAGAGALNVRLGGRARYQGKWHERPAFGVGLPPTLRDIERGLTMIKNTTYLWIGVALAGALIHA